MAELEITNCSKKRTHHNTRVDLTPMVDLGFLLITFFVFTTTISEPTAMKLNMPDDNGPVDKPSVVSKDVVLTILPGADNKAAVFEGDLKDNPVISKADLNSPAALRGFIIQKQQKIVKENKAAKNMMVIIKPGKECTYKNLIDVLDEMQINGVKKYAVVKRSPADEEAITKALL